MKARRLTTLILLSVMLPAAVTAGCGQSPNVPATNGRSVEVADSTKNTTMKITVGSKVFAATLFDNPTAAAFKAMLPLTLNMEELNGNEKKFDLDRSLPTNASNPGTINNGDLMIWGSNTVVLFYKSFPTSYSYTKLGRIEDPTGLEESVGKGNVKVTFEMERSPKE
jgi:hypothetical protein